MRMKNVFWFALLLFSAGAAAQTPVQIRIAYPSGMNGQIPVVMERTGIAKKHGLDAQFVFFQYGPPMMEALASGHIDAVVTSLMPVTTFLSRQPNAAVVVASLGRSSYSLRCSTQMRPTTWRRAPTTRMTLRANCLSAH